MPHVSCMYPACLLHIRYVFTRLSLDAFEIHVSHDCISDVSRMYLDHLCRYMYPECITVSCMYLASQIRASLDTLEVCISDCIPHVSRPRYMYRDFVSRRILMYRDEQSRIHVS